MRVRTLAMLLVGTLAIGGLAFAQLGEVDSVKLRSEMKLQEQRLLKQFKDFEEQLSRLKRRLEKSTDLDDKAKAELIEKLIERARDESIVLQFEQINAALKESKLTNPAEIKGIQERMTKLADDLHTLVDLMNGDPKYLKAKEEREYLEKLLKMLDIAIGKQRDVLARTELGKADPKELLKAQEAVTKLTGEIAAAIDKKEKGKGGEGGEAKNPKGEAKPGEAKGGKSGESRDGGKEGKPGESKGKEGKGAEGSKPPDGTKEASAKGSEGKGSEGAEAKAGAKEGAKGAEGKAGAKGSKGAEGAAGPKAAGKEGEKGKEGGAKDDGPKSSVKEKPGEVKGAEKEGAKSGDAPPKSGEAKPGPEGKEGKAGAKSSSGAESKSGPKEGSKEGAESKGEPKPGESSSGKSGSKSEGGEPGEASKSKSKGTPPGGDDKKEAGVGKKQVQDAEGYQKSAEKKIPAKDLEGAADDESDALTKLEEAKKKFEELLKQIREEELERLLAQLQARCEKMLAMQIRVRDETVNIDKTIAARADKKAEREDQIASIGQAREEDLIVKEASKAIEMLEAEGSAVAFPEVFQQVREDMRIVQRRLELTDVGVVTQATENDIIDTLKEMVDALKKAREENKDKKDSKPGKPGEKGEKADQKLLDQIAELKMIRSMQLRINSRTTTYGRLYIERDGEQARDANIRRELHGLSQRQERLTEVTGRIAKGDNK